MTVVHSARRVRLKFEIGARTLITIPRELVRVPLTLEEARAATLPPLPQLERDAHGYTVTSLSENLQDSLAQASGGMLCLVRQRYTRYFLDFELGFDAWFGGLSSNARQGLKRKAKKLAAESGGKLDVRSFRAPEELETFHTVARQISQRTYQERLLGSGLPEGPAFVQELLALAAADRARAWLLYIAGEPVAYLYCPIEGDTVIYAHVGHDPAFNDLSPGAVLMLEAMRDLFAEKRFGRFDFTEGEGQHKRQFATGGVDCVDLLLLRPSLTNRLTIAALGGFNACIAFTKRAVQVARLEKLAKKVRRGA